MKEEYRIYTDDFTWVRENLAAPGQGIRLSDRADGDATAQVEINGKPYELQVSASISAETDARQKLQPGRITVGEARIVNPDDRADWDYIPTDQIRLVRRDEWLTLAEAEREYHLTSGHIRDWLRRGTNRADLLSKGQLKEADQRTVLIKRGFVQMKWGEKATPQELGGEIA
jgi:hypothetical protein